MAFAWNQLSLQQKDRNIFEIGARENVKNKGSVIFFH